MRNAKAAHKAQTCILPTCQTCNSVGYNATNIVNAALLSNVILSTNLGTQWCGRSCCCFTRTGQGFVSLPPRPARSGWCTCDIFLCHLLQLHARCVGVDWRAIMAEIPTWLFDAHFEVARVPCRGVTRGHLVCPSNDESSVR